MSFSSPVRNRHDAGGKGPDGFQGQALGFQGIGEGLPVVDGQGDHLEIPGRDTAEAA